MDFRDSNDVFNAANQRFNKFGGIPKRQKETQQQFFKGASNWVEKNPWTVAFMLGGATMLLGAPYLAARLGANMRNFIEGFYGRGVGKSRKVGKLVKEAFIKALPRGSQQLRSIGLHRGYHQAGLAPGIKRDLDAINQSRITLLTNPQSWEDGVIHSGKLIKKAGMEMRFLAKKETGAVYNAFANLARVKGVHHAMKTPLYTHVVKNYAPVKTYLKHGRYNTVKTLKTDLGVLDDEVFTTALGKHGLVTSGGKLLHNKINIQNFRHMNLQNATRDIQFTNQAKLAFLAHEKGLIKDTKSLKSLQKFYEKAGYKVVSKNYSPNNMVLKSHNWSVHLKKTKNNTTLLSYSPSGKSQFHWGGFSGHVTFNDKLQGKGIMGVFGTDKYDVIGAEALEKTFLRKTPLLNVQSVKYKTVPIIKEKEIVQLKKSIDSKDVVSVSRAQKSKAKFDKQKKEFEKTHKYSYKEESPYSKEFYSLPTRPTRVPVSKAAEDVQLRAHWRYYSPAPMKYTQDVGSYYKLYTKIVNKNYTASELSEFMRARSRLGLPLAVGSLPFTGPWLYEKAFKETPEDIE